MNYKFNWSVLWTGESGQWLLSGLLTTIELSVVAWLIAVALGILSGALRTVRFWPLRAAATFYVEFFRNVVNSGLMDGIESGKFFEIYEKWFGPKGELPYPMSPQVRSFMLLQVVPK